MNLIKQSVPALLLSSALIFGVLVPGGPVETRNFSHISPWTLVAFNTFLTSLGLLSLVLAYLQIRRKVDAFMLTAFLGASYFAVYVLDLLHIFPISPDPAPQALWLLEILGMIVSLPLMATSIQAARDAGNSRGLGHFVWATGKSGLYVVLFLAAAGTGIIVFATYAAMGK